MHTEGSFAPETRAAARERYDELVPTAKTVVREVARAMAFDRDEYAERVTADVVATARDALFAGELRVHVGAREAFEEWCSDHPDFERVVAGSEQVDQVCWHPIPFAERVVAATFQNEPEAAVATLRRQAFGRFYRDAMQDDGEGSETDDAGSTPHGD